MKSTTGDIRIRISNEQKKILWNLAESHGFRTLSDYVRSKIFEQDLGVHKKLNDILEELKKQNKKKSLEVREDENNKH